MSERQLDIADMQCIPYGSIQMENVLQQLH